MKTVLQCDFCGLTLPLLENLNMVYHEQDCSFNPKNKTCSSCYARLDEEGGFISCEKQEGKGYIDRVKDCPLWTRESD